MLNLQQVHARYTQQAAWTRDMRDHLLSKMELNPGAVILELGSGTSAALADFDEDKLIFGADLEHQALAYAQGLLPQQNSVQADGVQLPHPANTFDLIFCHFLLLWVSNPSQILSEMLRTAKSGGWIAAFAEPDYGGRVDYPTELEALGRLQARALEQRGADTKIGRKLPALFAKLNLDQAEVGLIGMQAGIGEADESQQEQATWKRDLVGMASPDQIKAWETVENEAYSNSSRVQFIPTFFTIGRKP